MLDKYELEQQIKAMGDRDLLEFLARQQFETNCRCEGHEKQLRGYGDRLKALENSDKKMTAIGAIVGGAVSLLIAIGGFFLKDRGP